MKTPLRTGRSSRLTSPKSTGGQYDQHVTAERASAASGAPGEPEPASAVDWRASRAAERASAAVSALDESALFAATRATATASRALAFPPPAARESSAPAPPISGWRIALAQKLVYDKLHRRSAAPYERRVDRLEWEFEQMAERNVSRVTRAAIVEQCCRFGLTIADSTYVVMGGGLRIDQVIDRCFHLLGEQVSYNGTRAVAKQA